MASAAPRKRMALAVVVLGALAWAAFLRPANEAAVLTLDERYLQDDRVALMRTRAVDSGPCNFPAGQRRVLQCGRGALNWVSQLHALCLRAIREQG